MRRYALYILLTVLAGNWSANLSAQHRWVSPDFVKSGLPFVMSQNPCGLLWMDSLNISEVSLGFNKQNGGLVNYHQSDDDFELAAHAGSIYRFSPRIVMRGALDYSLYKGQHMSGSAFINPYSNAFDITEFDDAHQGDKKLETYHVQAEIGYNLYRGLIVGGKFDLVSANYSKMKDLRHSNTYSNLQFNVGLAYRWNHHFSLGANYHYIKTIENIYFKRYSISQKHYDVLISSGSFWGKRKAYNEPIGMISPQENPVINKYQGASLQLNYTPNRSVDFFLEGTFHARKGSYGIKSPTTIQYYKHDGNDFALSLTSVMRPSAATRHRLSLDFNSSVVTNYENVYKEIIDENQVGTVHYYDAVRMGKNSVSTFGLNYRGDWGIHENLPMWSTQFNAQIVRSNSDSESYPYYRQDKLAYITTSLEGERNIIHHAHLFTVRLLLGYHHGLKDYLYDGSHTAQPTQVKPHTSEMMFNREREYLTSPRLTLSPTFRYSYKFRALTAYAEATYAYRKAMTELHYLSSSYQHTCNITLGITI